MREELENPRKFKELFKMDKDQVKNLIPSNQLKMRIKQFLEGQITDISLSHPSPDVQKRAPVARALIIEEDESAEDKIKRLEQALKREKAAHEETKKIAYPILKLFEKQNVRGCVYSFNATVDSLSISLLAEGISAADIERFYTALAIEFPQMTQTPEMFLGKVPSVDYLESLRDKVPCLNQKQLDCYLAESNYLTLAVDGSSVLDSKKVLALSLINNEGKTLSLAIREDTCSSGPEICQSMKELLDQTGRATLIYSKLVALQTDRCRAQENVSLFQFCSNL